jgi:hypothetical protein
MAWTVVMFKDRPGDKRTFHEKTRLMIVTEGYRPIHQMKIMDEAGIRGPENVLIGFPAPDVNIRKRRIQPDTGISR